MAAPIYDSNLVRIIDVVAWLLENKLNNASGFRTDGVLVLRGPDPRWFQTNNAKEYSAKNRCVSIKIGDEVLDGKKSVGGTKRSKQIIELWCLASLTLAEQKNATPTIDMVEANLKTDLKWLFDNDNPQIALTALHAANPGKHYDQTSCINLKVEDFAAGSIVNWPNTHFLAICTVEFNEFRGRF